MKFIFQTISNVIRAVTYTWTLPYMHLIKRLLFDIIGFRHSGQGCIYRCRKLQNAGFTQKQPEKQPHEKRGTLTSITVMNKSDTNVNFVTFCIYKINVKYCLSFIFFTIFTIATEFKNQIFTC